MGRARDVCVNDNTTIKKIFNTKLNGVRRDGRPKMRWKDGVDQDLRILEVKNWKKFALDRDKWAKFLNTFSPGGVILLRDLSRHQSGRSNSTPRFS
jgi:hypothetical protein